MRCRVGADLGSQYHRKLFVQVGGFPPAPADGTGYDGHDVVVVVSGVVSEGVDV